MVFSKSMLCKYVRSNLGLIGLENVEGNKIPKANFKCACRFTRLLNLDTVHAMSRTNKPNSYVVLLSSHCRTEPNTFYCVSPEYNRLDLVRYGSSTAVARRMNWVIESFRSGTNLSMRTTLNNAYNYQIKNFAIKKSYNL